MTVEYVEDRDCFIKNGPPLRAAYYFRGNLYLYIDVLYKSVIQSASSQKMITEGRVVGT